jgi:hypothetical protein
MVLTQDELEEIRAECFADDLSIELDRMSLWTKDQACTREVSA